MKRGQIKNIHIGSTVYLTSQGIKYHLTTFKGNTAYLDYFDNKNMPQRKELDCSTDVYYKEPEIETEIF